MTATVTCNGWENNNKLVHDMHDLPQEANDNIWKPQIFWGLHSFFFGSTSKDLSSGFQSDPALSLSGSAALLPQYVSDGVFCTLVAYIPSGSCCSVLVDALCNPAVMFSYLWTHIWMEYYSWCIMESYTQTWKVSRETFSRRPPQTWNLMVFQSTFTGHCMESPLQKTKWLSLCQQ